MAGIGDWTVWKQTCALDLCPPGTQSELRAFARSRFLRYAIAYAHTTNGVDPKALTPEPAEAWHLFETWFRLRNTREGKSYKEWLFARCCPDSPSLLDAVQGGATLLMRDVVRERLARELPKRRQVSLNAPAWEGDEDAPELQELLPDASDTRREAERRELSGIAAAEALETVSGLNSRERVALLARELGLPLSHPAVVRAADCGKSQLSVAYHTALRNIAEGVRARHPDEENHTLASLSVAVFDATKKQIILWGRSEMACRPLFYMVEAADAGSGRLQEKPVSAGQGSTLSGRRPGA